MFNLLSRCDLEQSTLCSILEQDENAYAVSIQDDLIEKTGRRISLGAIYKTLAGLQRKGWITSREGECTARRGGRAKVIYRITGSGRRAIAPASKPAFEPSLNSV